MDDFPELKSIVDSFEDFRQLAEFADVTRIQNEPYVKERLLVLTKKAVEAKLNLPCNDTTTPLIDVPMEVDYGAQQNRWKLSTVAQKCHITVVKIRLRNQGHLMTTNHITYKKSAKRSSRPWQP